MISTFLGQYSALIDVFLVLVLLGAVAAAIYVATGTRTSRRVGWTVTIAATLGVIALTLSMDSASSSTTHVCNFTPVAFWRDQLNQGLLFVPALFATATSRKILLPAVAVPAFSAAIELTQFLLPALGRRCDIDDFLANTLGGLAAVVIGALLIEGIRRKQRRRPARTAPCRSTTESGRRQTPDTASRDTHGRGARSDRSV